jgi:hypothetical protein
MPAAPAPVYLASSSLVYLQYSAEPGHQLVHYIIVRIWKINQIKERTNFMSQQSLCVLHYCCVSQLPS